MTTEAPFPYPVTDVQARLKASAMPAPKVTQDTVLNAIKTCAFHRFPDTTNTVCLLVLDNGFSVVGQSACASADNFDATFGEELAYKDAVRQVWPLMEFRLRELLHERAQAVQMVAQMVPVQE